MFGLIQKFILFIAIFTSTATLHAQQYRVPIGTRPSGMGDAFVSVADDGNTVFWNPAGIGALGHHELNSMTTNAYQIGLRHQFLTYIFPFSDEHAIALSGFGEGIYDDAELEWRWDTYQFTYGRRFFKKYSVGMNLKYLNNIIGLEGTNLDNSNGLGFDLGILVPIQKFRFGLTCKDIGGLSIEHDNGRREIVYGTGFTFGISCHTCYDILLTGAVTLDDRIFFGTEYWGWNQLFAFRAGIQRDIYDSPARETIFSLGASLRCKIFQFDYAYTTHPTLLNSSRFSVSLAFSPWRSKVKINEMIFSPIFTSRYKDYISKPFGRVFLVNQEEQPVEAKVKLTIPRLMEKEMTFDVGLQPGKIVEVELTGVFSGEKIFSISKDEKEQVQIQVLYKRSDKDQYEKHVEDNSSVFIYRPGTVNSLKGPAAVASFISNNDPIIFKFTQKVFDLFKAELDSAKFEIILLKACILFDAIGQFNIEFAYDGPSFSPDNIRSTDDISYPRDMLKRVKQFGDCDDLTVLTASVFETARIETAIALSKNHLYLYFNTRIREAYAYKLQLDSKFYRVIDGFIWLPVETTKIGVSLFDAIQAAPPKNNLLEFKKVSEAWSEFLSSFPSKSADEVVPPSKLEILSLLKHDLNQIYRYYAEK